MTPVAALDPVFVVARSLAGDDAADAVDRGAGSSRTGVAATTAAAADRDRVSFTPALTRKGAPAYFW